MIASAKEGVPGGGLAPAFAAARARFGLVALLFALAGVGWWWTVHRMRGMDAGPWTGLGTLGWFLGVWVVMMGAMMFPSVAPTVALYSRLTRGSSPLAPLLFAAGYLVTWGGAGVLAFAIAVAGSRIAGDVLAWDRAGRWVAGATLLVAAVYELTPLKDVCLGKCRSPLGLRRRAARGGEDTPVAPRGDVWDRGYPVRARPAPADRPHGHSRPHDPRAQRNASNGANGLVARTGSIHGDATIVRPPRLDELAPSCRRTRKTSGPRKKRRT